MTSFTEEFFGCRFRRDRLKENETSKVPSSCCVRDKNARSKELPEIAEADPSDDPVLVAIEATKEHDHSKKMERINQRLYDFQLAVGLSVSKEVMPYISELDAMVRCLKQSRHVADENVSIADLELDPAHIATMVASALSSRFEDLANQTAAASSAVELVASSQRESSQICQHAMTADLVKQLLPQITNPLEKAVEDTLRPRLQELEHSFVDSRANHSSRGSSFHFTGGSNRDIGAGHSRERLKRQWPLGVIKRKESRSYNKLPRRAFVVNFRRLVEVQKILALIHEFIRSTAIATLTLVAAATWSQLVFSILFVALTLILFVVHEARYDKMDIEDYKSLVQLLEDDDGVSGFKTIQNPNRLLKALTLSRDKHRKKRSFISIVLCVVILWIAWINIFACWISPPSDDLWFGLFDFEDRMVQATLLLVGTAMVVFHISFEWLYWRETQCVMPTHDDRSWDPRSVADGVPNRYRWFGLPSMWFTSREAYDDLRLWITLSRKDGDVVLTRIHPEEMALFALQPEGASYLRKTLADAKLFSMGNWEFLARDAKGKPEAVKKGEDPDSLGISFVFYDKLTETYLQPGEDYAGGVMRLLTRTDSKIGQT